VTDYPVFETEKAFQSDLAADLRAYGWHNVRTEVPVFGGSHWLDIVAQNHPLQQKGLVIECKKHRPDNLTEAIHQLLRYKGTFKNPAAFDWVLSWPSQEISKNDRQRIELNGLHWFSPVELKDLVRNPDKQAKAYLSALSDNIDALEEVLKMRKDLHSTITRKLDSYETSIRLIELFNGAAQSISNQQAKPGKPR
jgi:Holliday junction resolvase